MKQFNLDKFKVEVEHLDDNQWTVTLRCGEFKYSYIAKYNYDIDDDGDFINKNFRNADDMKMEAMGQTWVVPQMLLNQMLDDESLNEDVQGIIEDDLIEMGSDHKKEMAFNKRAYESR
jgi:hypothetical protein